MKAVIKISASYRKKIQILSGPSKKKLVKGFFIFWQSGPSKRPNVNREIEEEKENYWQVSSSCVNTWELYAIFMVVCFGASNGGFG